MIDKTIEFINKAKEIHGDIYDYSKVKYKNCDTNVKIFCIKCNDDFIKTPYNHINKKQGCKKCNNFTKNKNTLEIRLINFINKAKAIHGNKYDYSKVIYTDSKTLVKIKCNVCNNEFPQIPNSHLLGDGGCDKCQKNKLKISKTFTKEYFIEKAIKVHGNKFDYSNIEYINSQTPIKIICKEHGDFEQIPNNHLRGKGCKKCAQILIGNKLKKTTEQFIIEAQKKHKDINNIPIYDYSKVEYISTHKRVIIICKLHGDFSQSPSDHLRSKGCNKCSIVKRTIKQTYTKEQFIEKAINIHGNKFDYSKVEYINSQTYVKIKCNVCNYEFPQIPNSHLQGCGCDNCAHIKNHNEQRKPKNIIIEESIKIHGNKFDYSNMNYINTNTPIDIKCNNCNNLFKQLYKDHINSIEPMP